MIAFFWFPMDGTKVCRAGTAPRLGQLVALLGGILSSAIYAPSAIAQNLETAAQNVNQESLAQNISFICPVLAGMTLTGDTADLSTRCTAAVTLAPTDQSGAAVILGQISPEEIVAQDAVVDGTMQPQSKAVAARLSALGLRAAGPQLSMHQLNGPVEVASTEPWQVFADNSGVSAFNTSGLGVFLNGSGGFGDKDQTSLETGYDFHSASVTAGVDYFFFDNFAAGVAFGYTGSEVEFDNNGGNLDADGFLFSTYGLWNPTDALGLTALIGYGRISYDSSRNIIYNDGTAINRTATGETDANQLEITTTANYDFRTGPFTYGPTGRMTYVYQDVDGFSETGAQGLNLSYDSRSSKSFQTALGAAVSYALSTGFGVTTLQARAEWIHEFLDDSEVFGVRYVNDNISGSTGFSITSDAPDRDRALVGGGVSMVFQDGISAFGDFETILALSDVNTYTFTAGIRKEF